MKKLMILALVALLLTGCGKDAPPVTEPTESPATTAPTEPETLPATVPTTEPETLPATEPEAPPTTAPTVKFDPAVCEEIFGQWHLPITLDGNLLMLTDFETVVTFDLIWSFSDLGQFTIGVDEAAFETAIATYESEMNVHLMESRFQIFSAECRLEGLWEWATNQKWENEGYREQNQAEVDAFIQQLDLRGRYAKLFRIGSYYIQDGLLMLEYTDGITDDADYITDGKNLILADLDNEAAYTELGIRTPLQLTGEE